MPQLHFTTVAELLLRRTGVFPLAHCMNNTDSNPKGYYGKAPAYRGEFQKRRTHVSHGMFMLMATCKA